MIPSRPFPTASQRDLASRPYYVVDNEQDAEALCEQTGEPVKISRLVREEIVYFPTALPPDASDASDAQTLRTSRRLKRPGASAAQTPGL
jgi:hypothetical protein